MKKLVLMLMALAVMAVSWCLRVRARCVTALRKYRYTTAALGIRMEPFGDC